MARGVVRTPVESPALAQRWADRQPYADDGSSPISATVTAGTRDGWTLVHENFSFQATDNPVAKKLSRNGVAIVLYQNPSGDSSEWKYAVHGRLVRDMDPFDQSPYGDSRPLPQEHGIPFGKYGQPYFAQSFALMLRLTGFRARPSDFTDRAYSAAVGIRY